MKAKFYCNKGDCAKENSNLYVLEIPQEALVDENNVADFFCPCCKSTLVKGSAIKKCPICSVRLKTTEKFGVEFDYCHQCHGVWVDRSEIDTILNRTDSFGNVFSSK